MGSPIDRTNKTALDTNLVNGITSDAPKVKANNDTLYNYVDTLNQADTDHASADVLAHPDGSVTTAKIANSAVTTPKLADASVTADKVADGSLTSSKFVSGALSNDTQNGLRIVSLETDVKTIKHKTANSTDRFFNLVRTTSQENAIVLIGDSITEGSNTTNFARDNYGSIIRKAVQKKYNNRNHGFVSFRDLSPYSISTYHSMVNSGFTISFNESCYGGILAYGTAVGAYIELTYTGKDAKLVYVSRTDGGVLSVILDGVNVGTIDTKVSGSIQNCTISSAIVASSWGQHTLRFEKADANTVQMSGVMYYEDSGVVQPIVHNAGRSSLTAFEIPDFIFDAYCGNGAVILALGVNDQLNSKDLDTFQNRITYACDKVSAINGSMIICDFMFSLPSDNPYKSALRTVAEAYPDFGFIDFAELWFGSDMTTNKYVNLLDSDGVHPTVQGHEFIGNTLLKYMGLPYTKEDVIDGESAFTEVATLLNGWVNYGSGFDTAGYRKDSNGYVHLKGLIKSGTATQNTTIFTLPAEYRPTFEKIFPVAAGGSYGEIDIDTSGNVKLNVTVNNAYLSLEGITFKTA